MTRLYFDRNEEYAFEAGRIIGEQGIKVVGLPVWVLPCASIDFRTEADAVAFRLAASFPTLTQAEFDLLGEQNRTRRARTHLYNPMHYDQHEDARITAVAAKLGLTIVERVQHGDQNHVVFATVEEREHFHAFRKRTA